MSTPANSASELVMLLLAAGDRSLTRQESERLRWLATNDEQAQKAYLDHICLISNLRWLSESIPNSESAVSAIPASLSLPTDQPSVRPSVTETPITVASPPIISFLTRPRFSSLYKIGYFLAVACCFYGAFTLVAWNLRPNQVPRVARDTIAEVASISDATHAHWTRGSRRNFDNPSIQQGESLKIDSGTIELELKAGARLVVEGPAQWSIDGDNHATLTIGKLVARVPQQAVGFTVETPTAKMVDLGTEFGVSVDKQGATEAQVFRGVVEIETVKATQSAPQTKEKRKLVAGEAARVDATAKVPQIQAIVAKPEKFIRQLSNPSKRDHEPSAYTKYVIEKTKPVLYWNFDNSFLDVTKDLVRSQSADDFQPLSINQPGPRPTDGFALMGAANRAASVAGNGNVSCHQLSKKLNVPTNAYSAQIWFNSSVSFGDRYVHHFLCRGNSSQNDGVRDSLFVNGNYDQTIQAGYLGYFDGDFSHKDRLFVGKTLLDRDRWYLATLVRDGDPVRIYLDGALEIDVESPWHGGEGDYLTFGHRVNLMAGLGLTGRFDEVAVWDRALSADEVSRLYEAAKDTPLNQSRGPD